MREFWTEFAWAKGARLQGSRPVGQVGAGRASPPGMEKMAWQAWMAGWQDERRCSAGGIAEWIRTG